MPSSACCHRSLHSFPTRRSSDLTSAVPATRTKLDMTLYLLLALFFFTAVAGFFAFPLAVRFFFAAFFLTARGLAFFDFFTGARDDRSEEHTSELQSPYDLVCRLLHAVTDPYTLSLHDALPISHRLFPRLARS